MYCELPGTLVAGESLRLDKAHDLWRFLSSGIHSYARFVSATKYPDGTEAVIFDVDPELPQLRVYEILPTERIATIFWPGDHYIPETLALRNDFPAVEHVNPREQEFPRSLCIYEEAYVELRLRWTAAAHIERVRTWLSENARGELHKDDQPVEQIFVHPVAPLIVPADYGRGGPDEPLVVSYLTRPSGLPIFVGSRHSGSQHPPVFSVLLTATPAVNVRVRAMPPNLFALHELLKEFGIDTIGELSSRIKLAGNEPANGPCLVIVRFPLLRPEGGEIERFETWGFASRTARVEDIGAALGLWQRSGNFYGALIGQRADEVSLRKIDMFPVNPQHMLCRESAALFNGSLPSEVRIAAIGAGTLGSRVIMNCVRAGFGCWSIIDSDFHAPHNVARHELTSSEVSLEKAAAIAQRANQIYEGAATAFDSIDVTNPGAKKSELDALLSNSDVICDLSASVAVAREIACDKALTARRVSLFLNPTGHDLVILCEDAHRRLRLDDIEMQYYQYVANTPELRNHLQVPPERIRYARSCRDVSSRISNEDVVICAAVGSRLLRKCLSDDAGSAKIVAVRDETMSSFQLELSAISVRRVGSWSIRISGRAIQRMREQRNAKLPKETGGVLIGSIDVSRRIIYVTDGSGSPLDSEEYPMSYVRGIAALQQQVDHVLTATDGQLRYLGEWHSHPDGYSTNPSEDDKKLFDWLTQHLARDGMPPVMCIVGQKSQRWFVDQVA